MIEPEMAFCDLQGDMDLAEELVNGDEEVVELAGHQGAKVGCGKVATQGAIR